MVKVRRALLIIRQQNMCDTPEIKSKNIKTAKDILSKLKVDAEFSAYSDTNGISVYFTGVNGEKYRVSDHSVSSKQRLDNEIPLYFDQKQLGPMDKITIKPMLESNKRALGNVEKEEQKQTTKETTEDAKTDNDK